MRVLPITPPGVGSRTGNAAAVALIALCATLVPFASHASVFDLQPDSAFPNQLAHPAAPNFSITSWAIRIQRVGKNWWRLVPESHGGEICPKTRRMGERIGEAAGQRAYKGAWHVVSVVQRLIVDCAVCVLHSEIPFLKNLHSRTLVAGRFCGTIQLWTSTLRRTQETAGLIEHNIVDNWVVMRPRAWHALDEIYAGVFDGSFRNFLWWPCLPNPNVPRKFAPKCLVPPVLFDSHA